MNASSRTQNVYFVSSEISHLDKLVYVRDYHRLYLELIIYLFNWAELAYCNSVASWLRNNLQLNIDNASGL